MVIHGSGCIAGWSYIQGQVEVVTLASIPEKLCTDLFVQRFVCRYNCV